MTGENKHIFRIMQNIIEKNGFVVLYEAETIAGVFWHLVENNYLCGAK